MPVETGTTIEDLDDLWPLSGDAVLEGDNHLRLIKAILKAQFPGVGGDGFATAITATEAEINYLSGVTSGIQAQLDAQEADFQGNLYAPAGTVMIFHQAAAPTGWTQVLTFDNSMLRVVNSGDGSGAGTDSPISWASAHVHTTAGHTLTIAEVPAHTHSFTAYGSNGGNAVETAAAGVGTSFVQVTSSSGGGGSHTHGDTGSAGATFTPRYINVIKASKDA